MDLKNTINNTNTQKENIKTVATNIDSKLVELGGERATDLADVVNKMGAMVGQYKKIAEGEYNQILKAKHIRASGAEGERVVEVKMPLNLNFTPSRIVINSPWVSFCDDLSTKYPDIRHITIDSKYNNSENNSIRETINSDGIFIKNITKTECTLGFIVYVSTNDNVYNDYTFLKPPIKWVAIG